MIWHKKICGIYIWRRRSQKTLVVWEVRKADGAQEGCNVCRHLSHDQGHSSVVLLSFSSF